MNLSIGDGSYCKLSFITAKDAILYDTEVTFKRPTDALMWIAR